MVHNENQFSFNLEGKIFLQKNRVEYRNIIIDRKSKYSVVAFEIKNLDQVKEQFKNLKQDAYFRKATHNTYAYRVQGENKSVIEGKNDDGEKGAGMCVLRELQRENTINMMLVITRYFGGIQLHGDRFRNVVDACKIFFEKEKYSK